MPSLAGSPAKPHLYRRLEEAVENPNILALYVALRASNGVEQIMTVDRTPYGHGNIKRAIAWAAMLSAIQILTAAGASLGGRLQR